MGSYLVPKDRDLLVFTSSDGTKFRGNPKYLYKYFLGKKKVVWITRSRDLDLALKGKGLVSAHTYSLEGMKATLRAGWIVVDDSFRGPFATGLLSILGRFRILQTWHGAGLKTSGLLDPNMFKNALSGFTTQIWIRSFDVILATSQMNAEFLRKEFRSDRIAVTGYPRNDCLFDRNLIDVDFKKSFSLDRFSNIILYAPTFRDSQQFCPFSEEFLHELNEWLTSKNYILIVKRHPYDRVRMEIKLSNIVDLSDEIEDVQEILCDVDVLITDYSSIATDFVLLDRPVIFYLCDHEEYLKTCRPLLADIDEGLPGPFAFTEEELLALLKDLRWFSDPLYKKRYYEFRDRFHHFVDGNSCRRVEELLFGDEQ